VRLVVDRLSHSMAKISPGGLGMSGANLCPVCGPVAVGDSSRYCQRHLRALLAEIRALLARAA
jgi:hypothetical protein